MACPSPSSSMGLADSRMGSPVLHCLRKTSSVSLMEVSSGSAQAVLSSASVLTSVAGPGGGCPSWACAGLGMARDSAVRASTIRASQARACRPQPCRSAGEHCATQAFDEASPVRADERQQVVRVDLRCRFRIARGGRGPGARPARWVSARSVRRLADRNTIGFGHRGSHHRYDTHEPGIGPVSSGAREAAARWALPEPS